MFTEKKVKEYIEEVKLPFKFVGNRTYWAQVEGININPDFVNTDCSKKEFIEALGCFWHGCKVHPHPYVKNLSTRMQARVNRAINLDKVKQTILPRNGYRVLYIWEHEVTDGSFREKINNFWRLK